MGSAVLLLVLAGFALVLAGCGAAATPSGAPPGGPGVTAEPATAQSATTQPPSTQPPATESGGGPAAAPTTGAPLTIPLKRTLGGVPPRPLPASASNAVADAQYACRWYGDLSELLADASSQGNVAKQGAEDIRQLAAFAHNAGAGKRSFAKLASDAAKLDRPRFLAKLAHPLGLSRTPEVVAVGTDCQA